MTDDDPQPLSGPGADSPPADSLPPDLLPAGALSGPDAGAADGLTIEVDDSDSPAVRLASLEASLAKAEQDKKDNWEKFVRASADLENYRRRARRDLDDAKADARTRVLKEMLPVLDNLERAVAAGADDTSPVLEGVRLVLRQFATAFERLDVTPIDAEAKPFDPNLHEAIGQQESDAPPGSVASVLQRGYKIGDRLLRPALVVVAKPRTIVEASSPDGEMQG
jgi:molecular chaperone GrpE